MAEYTQLYSGLGWGTTFEMNAKKPLIAKRSFPTLNDAYGYVNDLTATGTACPGLIIAVTADTNDKNNGIYWIKSIGVAGVDGELVPGELIKAGSGTGSMSIATLTVADNKVTEATADNIGQIIYVTTGTDTYPAGPYIVTGDGTVAKLGTTTATGDIAGDVETLKGKVGTLETTVGNDKSGLVKDVADIKTGYVAKVEGQRLMTDAEGTKLAGIADGAEVNYVKSVGDNLSVDADGKLTVTIPEVEVPFQSVVAGDKVLTLANGVLSSTLSYAREVVNGVDSLVLKGIDGAVIGSVPVADFVADGMLESVTEVQGTNKFKFTFKKVDGSTEDFEVDFGKFVDTYHADGTTLELDSTTNTFKVKDGVFAAADTLESAKSYTDTALADYTKTDDLATELDLASYAKASALNDYTKTADLATELDLASYAKASALNDYTKTEDLSTELKLDEYAKTADVNNTLAGYVTSGSLTTTLGDYAKTADVNNTLAGYVTSDSLSTTLGDYVTSDSLSTTLGDYAKTSDVTATLASYVTSDSLSTTLGDYAKTSDVTATLASYVTSDSLSTTLGDYVKSTAITTSSSVTLTTEGALEVNAISIDDLKTLGILSE